MRVIASVCLSLSVCTYVDVCDLYLSYSEIILFTVIGSSTSPKNVLSTECECYFGSVYVTVVFCVSVVVCELKTEEAQTLTSDQSYLPTCSQLSSVNSPF